MAIDTNVARSRRALLAGGLGGIAALVAGAFGRAAPVRGADDEFIQVGHSYTATGTTQVTNTTTSADVIAARTKDGWAINGYATGAGIAVYAEASSGAGTESKSVSGDGLQATSVGGAGVWASSSSNHGVYGSNYSATLPAVVGVAYGHATGVQGFSGAYGPIPPAPDKTGVFGYANQDAGAAGVRGESLLGSGVIGETSGTGKAGVVGRTAVSGANGVLGQNTATDAIGVLAAGLDGVHGGTEKGIGVLGTSYFGPGVQGGSAEGSGVYGQSGSVNAAAVLGKSSGSCTGVQGFSGTAPLPAAPAKTGVYGYASQDVNARGVHGQTTSGRGVYGQATSGFGLRGYASSGTAVYASTSGPKAGTALRTVGKVKFDNSVGIATISMGSKSVLVTPGIDLTTTSAVVATLQGNAGGVTAVQRVAVDPTADTFTIWLTSNATMAVKVAWHVFG